MISPFFEPRHVLYGLGNLDGGAFSVFVLGRFETGPSRLGFLDDFFGHLLTFSNGLLSGFFRCFAGLSRGFGFHQPCFHEAVQLSTRTVASIGYL